MKMPETSEEDHWKIHYVFVKGAAISAGICLLSNFYHQTQVIVNTRKIVNQDQ